MKAKTEGEKAQAKKVSPTDRPTITCPTNKFQEKEKKETKKNLSVRSI